MELIELDDNLDKSIDTGACYLNYCDICTTQSLGRDTNIENFIDTIDKSQIIIIAQQVNKALVIVSQRGAVCLTFYTSDYSQFTERYMESCYIKTFRSEGNTYLFMIYNHVLQNLVNSVYKLYETKMEKPLKYFFLRISSEKSFITNIEPSNRRERFLPILLKPNNTNTKIHYESDMLVSIPEKLEVDEVLKTLNDKK